MKGHTRKQPLSCEKEKEILVYEARKTVFVWVVEKKADVAEDLKNIIELLNGVFYITTVALSITEIN